MVVEVLSAIEKLCDEMSSTHQCTKCDNTFNKKQSLEKHIANEHAESDDSVKEKKGGKYDCEFCDSSFRRERNLKLHIRDDHENDDEDEETVPSDTVGFDIDVEYDPNLVTYNSDQEDQYDEVGGVDDEEASEEMNMDANSEEIHGDATLDNNEEVTLEIDEEASSLVINQEMSEEINEDDQEMSHGINEEDDQEMSQEINEDEQEMYEETNQEDDQEMSQDINVEDASEEVDFNLEAEEIMLDGNPVMMSDIEVDSFPLLDTENQEEDGGEEYEKDEQEIQSNIFNSDVEDLISEGKEEQNNIDDTENDPHDENNDSPDGEQTDNNLDILEDTVNDPQDDNSGSPYEEQTSEYTQDNIDQSEQDTEVQQEVMEETEYNDASMVDSETEDTVHDTESEEHDNGLEQVEEEASLADSALDFQEFEVTNPLEESVGLDSSFYRGEDPIAMVPEQYEYIEDQEVECNENINETTEEFLLNGEPIVMDDIAFDILANTLEMTMETPEGEVDLSEEPLVKKPKKEKKSKSSKKRKSEEKLEEMVSPIDKKIKEEPQDEIELSGEPIFSSAPAPLSVLKAELKKKEVMKAKVLSNKSKPFKKEYSYPVAKKLICSYCKQIFPSRPDFNDHMAAAHPDILSKHNTAARMTKAKEVPAKKSEIKSISRSVKITHIPTGPSKANMVVKSEKLEKVHVKEAEIIMKSIPKSTRIIFTPVPDAASPSKTVSTVRPTTITTPNIGKGVKITQIFAKDAQVPITSKSLKIIPTSSKSVTITSTPGPSKTIPAKKLLCTYCKSVFLSRPEFNQHILKDHPDISNSSSKVATKSKKGAYKCNLCQVSFEEKPKYEQHLDVKHGHKCDNCNVSFRVKSKLEDHKRTAHSFKCSICNQKFVTSEKLTAHMESHNIKCDQCPEVFKSKMKMLDHKKVKHSYKCEKCNVRFDEKNKLEAHMEKHRFKCDKCTEVFDTKMKVLDHKKASHNFKCDKCKRSFDEKPSLEEHIKNNHVLKCKVCNADFDFKNKLEDHIKKDHYFKCNKCEESFELEESLTDHEKEKHSSCETCEDEFSWAEPGHSCYYTKNNIRPTKERVQVQNLYFDY